MFPDEGYEEVYSDDGRNDKVENDEMSADEEAFMSGYDEERNKTADGEDSYSSDDEYDKAFAKKKRRRSKRQSQSFDAEEIEAEVTLR
ncbi:MAG: hypothetical protein ACOCZV_02805 [Nanoarchaeota archaeon]